MVMELYLILKPYLLLNPRILTQKELKNYA